MEHGEGNAKNQRSNMWENQEAFFARFGKPKRMQALGDIGYWYYDSSDGEAQVVVSQELYDHKGWVYIKEVNLIGQ